MKKIKIRSEAQAIAKKLFIINNYFCVINFMQLEV